MEQHWYVKTNTPPAPFTQLAGKMRKQAEKQMRREWLADLVVDEEEGA